MGIENYRYAAVNMSSTKIPVYEKLVHSSGHAGGVTVGGSVIGHIHQYEFYTIIPNDTYTITSFKIYFLDGNNVAKYGYIQTQPGFGEEWYSWNKYQYPYMYYNSNGSALVESKTATINNSTWRLFTTKREVKWVNKDKSLTGTIAKGKTIATNSSTTGQTLPGYMMFTFVQTGSTTWDRILRGQDYVFVDLDIAHGAMPNNRAIW